MRKLSKISRLPKTLFAAMSALAAVTFLVPSGATAQDMVKISAAAIGRPPIFSNTFADVGEEMGFFKASGVEVDWRWFQRGSDTAKSVVTGDVAVGYTSTQAALNLIASGAPVVAIAGMNKQDWLLATDDPEIKECKDLKGKTVTDDGINNARTLYLAAVVADCGLQYSDMTTMNLANQPLVKAGIAGQVHAGIFHVDELAQVEFETGKKWRVIKAPPEIKAGLHYAVLLASKKAVAENREGLIRYLEAWILTQNMMGSKSAADKVAFARVASEASKKAFAVSLAAIDNYQSIDYWQNNAGVDEKQMMSQVDVLVKVGAMKADKKPSYGQIVDTSLYDEAFKRVEEKYGKLE